MGSKDHVLDGGSRSDKSFCSREGRKLAIQSFDKVLWSLVLSLKVIPNVHLICSVQFCPASPHAALLSTMSHYYVCSRQLLTVRHMKHKTLLVRRYEKAFSAAIDDIE